MNMYVNRIILPAFSFFLLLHTQASSIHDIHYILSGNCAVRAKFSPDQDSVVQNSNPVLLTNQSVNASSYTWFVNGTYVSSGINLTLSPVAGVNEIMLVASDGTCSDTAYSYLINNGTAAGSNGNLKKQFDPPGMAIEPFCMAIDKANGYLLAGDYFLPSNYNFETRTTCLIRIDESGCVTWSKSMIKDEEEVVQAIIPTSDTGFLVSAFPFQSETANYPNFLIVFKLDKLGNTEWANAYSSGSSVINYFSAICETSDKGFVLETGSFPSGTNPSFYSIIKMDREGGVMWGRKLSMENNILYNIGGIIEKNGFVYATGSMYENVSSFHLLRSFLAQLNMGTGITNWTKQNDPAQPGISFTDVHSYKQGLMINGFTGNSLSVLLHTDNNGNLFTTNIINNPYGSLHGGENIIITPEAGLYFHQSSGTLAGPKKDIIMKLDSNQQILWQQDLYSQDQSFAGWYQLSPAPARGIAGIGSGVSANGLEVLTFLKLDSAGESCGSGKSELSIEPINTSLIPMNWDINTDLPLVVSSIPLNLSPLSIESRLFCPKYGNGCDLLKLKGPRVLCQLKDTAVYILHTDPSCPDSITWSYDSANISVLSKGSGGLTLNFNKEGSFLIKAGKSGCNTITDSILVTVGNNLSDVHLPEDTALCFGYNLVLDAGAGYNSYLWQDGSNTQSISVSTPGIYWVKLTSGNDCISTDTSRVTGIVQLPAHFLAADTVICSYSSLLLQSLQSYSSYLWSTGETSSAIEVKTPGIYWLEAVDKNGCKGADTIRVITKNCPYGIYFPNAFTPNKDGHNDQFRPIVIGNPVKYHFNIYNRLGRRIFSTTDPKKGWDGQIGGADQETGTYIWTCSFQFGGEKENKEAGNFILIR